jgi:hypothetical protein
VRVPVVSDHLFSLEEKTRAYAMTMFFRVDEEFLNICTVDGKCADDAAARDSHEGSPSEELWSDPLRRTAFLQKPSALLPRVSLLIGQEFIGSLHHPADRWHVPTLHLSDPYHAKPPASVSPMDGLRMIRSP